MKIGYDTFYYKHIKPKLGFIFAIFLVVLLLPLYVVISIAIILDDGFPVFYRGERGGYRGKTFKIYKFRSMVKDADKIGGGTTALNDSRITKVGYYLRKTKLDEIPQLFNILNGTMSFIGPRPELLKYTMQYQGEETCILMVRPGITDFSSIEFISLDEMVGCENADEMYENTILKHKNQLRIKYVNSVSFRTDVKIFSLTVFMVIKKIVKFIVK